MASNTPVEEDLKRLTEAIQKCLKPHHRIYVRDHTILVHREDAKRDGWGLVKLGIIISGTDWKPTWYLELYDTPDEYNWKVILWNPKKD